VYTKEGTMLFPVDFQKGNSWVMAAKLTPDQVHIVRLFCVIVHSYVFIIHQITAAHDGTLIYYDINMSTVHGLHRDRYVWCVFY